MAWPWEQPVRQHPLCLETRSEARKLTQDSETRSLSLRLQASVSAGSALRALNAAPTSQPGLRGLAIGLIAESLAAQCAHIVQLFGDRRMTRLAQRNSQFLNLQAMVAQPLLRRTTRRPGARALSQWLGNLAVLKGLPFGYLVPDQAMLPAESIRFFVLDPTGSTPCSKAPAASAAPAPSTPASMHNWSGGSTPRRMLDHGQRLRPALQRGPRLAGARSARLRRQRQPARRRAAPGRPGTHGAAVHDTGSYQLCDSLFYVDTDINVFAMLKITKQEMIRNSIFTVQKIESFRNFGLPISA